MFAGQTYFFGAIRMVPAIAGVDGCGKHLSILLELTGRHCNRSNLVERVALGLLEDDPHSPGVGLATGVQATLRRAVIRLDAGT